MNVFLRFWRRSKLEQDLGKELHFHISERIAALKSMGLSDVEARRRARQEFGGTEQVKEQCRDARGTLWLESAIQDLRYSVRSLRNTPGFALTAILTLALGIGANTAIFTLVHEVMLKSLPVADPGSLIRIGDGDNCCVLGGLQGQFSAASYPLYTCLRDHTPEFAELTAFQAGLGRVGVRRAGANAASTPLVDQFVSGNFFTTFGLHPFAGRLLSTRDDVPAAAPVAVMSYRAWQQQYGADPSIVGSPFVIDGSPYMIVGIAPPGFFGAMMRPDPPDLWMPIADEPAAHKLNSLLDANLRSRGDESWLYVIGRVRPGTDIEHLESEINVEFRRWYLASHPSPTEAVKQELARQYVALVSAGGGIAQMKSNYEHDLRLLIAITTLVLLITCANLANLQLARGAANLGQISVRLALGASRSRIIRQVLTESLVLAFAGGATGLIVAAETARLLIHLAFPAARYVPVNAAPSLPVLGFAFAVSLITGIVFGIGPAFAVARGGHASALHTSGRFSARITLPQKSLVILQAVLSLVLVAGAGLMVETLRNLQNQQFGFQTEGSVVVNVNAGFGTYAPEKLAAIYRDIQIRMRQIPGVRNAALALYSPMSGNNWQSGVTLEEHPNRKAGPVWDRVSPSFFAAIGARLLRGRIFDERDTPAATHVAVVNQAFADNFFPRENPIGKRFGFGGIEQSADYQIVGVVNNIVFRNPRQPAPPMFFLPLLQMSKDEWKIDGKARSNFIECIILRVNGHPANLNSQIHRALSAIDPNLTVINVMTMEQQVGGLLRHEVLITRLAELFGILALALASVGLYGITSYSVARRSSEIGIRTALGATRLSVIRLILASALSQVGIALLIGIPAALGAGRVLENILYGVKTSDPVILGGAALTLGICATVAGFIPALRASSVDPVSALRVDY